MTGEQLKERREALQLDLKEIANVLRIKLEYLQAIEQDAFDKLPVAVYAIGYIRTYADYLDIEPEPIIEYFSEHLSRPKAPSIVPFALIEKKRTWRYVLIPVVLVTALFLIIFFSSSGELPFLNKPVFHDDPGMKDSSLPADIRTEGEITDSAEHLIESDEHTTQEKLLIPRIPAVMQQEINSTPEIQSDQQQTPKESHDHVLEIRATDVTWVRIHAGAHNARELLFQPGQSKRVSFSGKTVLKIGNAGGIILLLDGDDLGSLGQPGEVIRLSIPEE